MFLITDAFLFIALFRMTFPSVSEKNDAKTLKMSFCDSRDLEKIASVPIRTRICGLPSPVALMLCSRRVLALRL